MTRREFITLLGGTAAWPFTARAQQPAMPVVGFLEIRSPETISERLRAFRQGLKETGYIAGENIAIDYRWAEQRERLPDLETEVHHDAWWRGGHVTAGGAGAADSDADSRFPRRHFA